jgi:hypothetical protein
MVGLIDTFFVESNHLSYLFIGTMRGDSPLGLLAGCLFSLSSGDPDILKGSKQDVDPPKPLFFAWDFLPFGVTYGDVQIFFPRSFKTGLGF